MANKVVRPDGTVRVRIIGPGKGSSATYEADQLKRDMGVFKRGTQVFLDHPGRREEGDRPERSIRDLCGVSVADPVWEENGPKGPGPYTDVRVFKHFQPIIEEVGSDIGVSIRAAGSLVTKTVNGEPVRVAEKFTAGSFDFVTKAGAGGAVVPFSEAAKSQVEAYVGQFLAQHPQSSETSDQALSQFIECALADSATDAQKEDSMALEARVAELEKENATLKESKAQLESAAMAQEAQTVVAAEVLKSVTLPDVARARITEAFKVLASPVKEGKLDKEALVAAVSEAVKRETHYIESLKSAKKITGMGGGLTPDDIGAKQLREAYEQRFLAEGKSEKDAKAMAETAARGY